MTKIFNRKRAKTSTHARTHTYIKSKKGLTRLELALKKGTVSGSGTGPLDYGATGPAPDTEPRL